MASQAIVLPADVLVEEEKRPEYDAKTFYPVAIGEVLHKSYKVVFKVGYGANSTVWMARNIQR